MRKSILIIAAVLMVAVTIPAFAELQNVTVGGALRIRGNWNHGDDLAGRPNPDDNISFVEQRTTVNVKADFTDMVSAYIELENYGAWGRNDDGVDVYEAYIEANEMYGHSLRLRIGRQELVFGSEFLLGNESSNSLFMGLSYDAILDLCDGHRKRGRFLRETSRAFSLRRRRRP